MRTENKEEFIQRVKLALKADKRSAVEDIKYEKNSGLEIITVTFMGGHEEKINATHNSNGANFQEIGRAVYGSGAHGRIDH